MSSIFGRIFQVSSWGESHGKAVGCVVDGCPSNLSLDESVIQRELDKRRPGQSEVTTSRREADEVEIVSGVFEGKTTGTPISMLVANSDADSSKYENLVGKPRPSHADYTYREKYGNVDWRGGGRASARETVARVAAGAVAGKILERMKVQVTAYTKQVGEAVSSETLAGGMRGVEDLIYSNSVRALDSSRAKEMEEIINTVKRQGDSVGGVVECVALNVPAGVGEPCFDKINARLGAAILSIPACKGVEFGDGFDLAIMRASEVNDEFQVSGKKVSTAANHSGGIQGGISNGMPVILRAVFKPTASIGKKQKTVDLDDFKNTEIKISGRHDPCIVPRAVPVVEAMAKIVLADMMVEAGFIPRKFE